ncbi:hypothetical protein [Polyangium sp. 6x1]|uniref:hypothetical protein n=1 Tax=Polyangium sp. 6x1 TaxID=3042689 RepID=UPI0024826AF2|nr:hypothetical protein [Polyangium sp. 6x1]MDI1449864.1 hypothetical protein [Polyangium sp. 6x1]
MNRIAGLGLSALCASTGCAPAPETDEETGLVELFAGAYDHCANVLEGDLFNRISSQDASASNARTIIWQTFLSMNENDAYQRYSNYHDEAHRAGGGGGLSVFGLFDVNGSGADERKLTRQQFGELYRHMRSLNASASSSDWSQSSSFTSAYTSYIRDANTIEAWRQCVTARPEPGLYAYGSRDDAGNAYVQVVWSPGNFAGIAPAIEVEFVAQEGFTMDPGRARVAVGTGRSFAVRGAASSREFEVHVNGTYQEVGSFQAQAKIPPAVVPSLVTPDGCEQRRLSAFFAGTLPQESLGKLRSFGYVPIHNVQDDPSSRVMAYLPCDPSSP